MTMLRDFNAGLYREHLEESSFLYEQRLAYLRDPEVLWPNIRLVEERLEAHIDALVIAGEPAIAICRQASDVGEVHCALCVFCRLGSRDDALALLDAIDSADERAVYGASRSLLFEAPGGWRKDLLSLLQRGRLTPVVAQVAGLRRYPAEDVLSTVLAANPPLGSADLAWALGRVGTSISIPILASYLHHADDRVCEAAALALLRLGDDGPLGLAMSLAGTHRWARRILGVAGSPRSVGVLLDVLSAEPDRDTVLALGLHGDLRAVAPLVELLEHEELGLSAAVALNAITGAELYGKTFIPDKFDLDELFEDELDAYRKDGTLPKRFEQSYGNWEQGPLRDAAVWRSWLSENKHRFSRNYRWRMGRPYGPRALFECLRCAYSPYAVRCATYEELVVRYGFDVPFEVDLRVSQQTHWLRQAERWITGKDKAVPDGHWYFAGRPQN